MTVSFLESSHFFAGSLETPMLRAVNTDSAIQSAIHELPISSRGAPSLTILQYSLNSEIAAKNICPN